MVNPQKWPPVFYIIIASLLWNFNFVWSGRLCVCTCNSSLIQCSLNVQCSTTAEVHYNIELFLTGLALVFFSCKLLLNYCAHTSEVMAAILDGETCPLMTFCLRDGFFRSPRLDTRLLILILYLLPVSLNSENTRKTRVKEKWKTIIIMYISSTLQVIQNL